MLVFSSTASGKSLVTCLIRVFIWIIMNLRALVRKEENATYLCSACYVFLKRAVRICVARLLNFACHLFCPLFVWSMNTMILILPQCVSFDIQRITRAGGWFLEGKFISEILQEQRSVWKCWGEIQKLWISWRRNVKYIWRRNSEGSRSLIARTCSNESGPSCNWIPTPWLTILIKSTVPKWVPFRGPGPRGPFWGFGSPFYVLGPLFLYFCLKERKIIAVRIICRPFNN